MANDSQPAFTNWHSYRGIVNALGLVGWIVVCFAAAAAGARFGPDDWFAQLNRPAFAPPDYLFGPVWTFLYLSMATSAWLVWRRDRLANTWRPLGLFLSQLVLNAAWTCLFFGLHRIDWALFDIVLLLGAILATIYAFLRVSCTAGLLLFPYFAWVAFATALNYAYWRLNA